MKRFFRQLHLWLSVPFGLLITLICFSGAMLVFEPEVEEWLHPELYRVEAGGQTALPVEVLIDKVAGTLPEGVTVKGVTQSDDPERAWRVNLSKPKRAAVFIDPYTGEIKGAYKRGAFFTTMFRLHRWLLDSMNPRREGVFWGKMVVGVSTLLFVFILLSGIVIWWPRTLKGLRNSLKIRTRGGWHRFWHSLHVAGGMYVLLLLLVMALTGLTWSFGWYRTAFYDLFGIESRRVIYALHVGSWGGMTTRILWFIAALIGAALPLTGYYLWLRRLYRRHKSFSNTSSAQR